MSRITALLIFALFIFSSVGFSAEKMKVACLGDSITFGVGAKNRKENSYPAQLQKILGDAYEVKNFGTSGIKMTNYLNKWKKNILEFQPNFVTIKLGTNDTKGRKFEPAPGNKEVFDKNFSRSAEDLLTFLSGLKSKPKVFICLPVPVFKTRWGINEKSLTEDIIPALKKMAKEKELGLIDFYTPIKSLGKEVPDGIHPNEKVYTILANLIAQNIKPER